MNNNPQKRPVRFFNTTGPCNPWDHYMLPPKDRLVGAQIHRYIRDKLYWVLHAPRQTGKTTFLQSWAGEINSGTEAVVCYVSLERCQGIPETERSMPDLCKAVQDYAAFSDLPVPDVKTQAVNSMLTEVLINWSKLVVPKPLIVLFDEVDVLEGESLISFLRQLRGGFMERGIGKFPVSIALVGMRDLKDYITESKGGVAPNPGSPFNIKSDSAMLSNFTQIDVEKLFAQRTEETGQQITDDALEYVYEQSQGQPWIVNSLYMRVTMRIFDLFGNPVGCLTSLAFLGLKPRKMLFFRGSCSETEVSEQLYYRKMSYTEAFPHLLLMAFLQRVLNGGGRIDREYAAGRGRMDLEVEYNNKIYIIEIKLIHIL